MSKNVYFHWEIRDGPFIFDKNVKYVVYFKGCFSPPHLGHLNAIYDIVNDNPNVNVVINQIDSKERHGIHYWINRKIWHIYIDSIFPKDRVSIRKYKRTKELFNHRFFINADRVMMIRGNENYDIDQTEKRFLSSYDCLINELSEKGVEIDYYFQERSKDVLSATRFVEQLLNCKLNNGNTDNLKPFLPKDLSDNDYNKIINMLMSCYLII